MSAILAAPTHDRPASLGSAPGVSAAERLRVTLLYLGTAVVLFLAMGLLGLTRRAHQADLIPLAPAQFYAILTLPGHGARCCSTPASPAG